MIFILLNRRLCCKGLQLNTKISQGIATINMRPGGRLYNSFFWSSLWCNSKRTATRSPAVTEKAKHTAYDTLVNYH